MRADSSDAEKGTAEVKETSDRVIRAAALHEAESPDDALL
jgi:hypothetical protein